MKKILSAHLYDFFPALCSLQIHTYTCTYSQITSAYSFAHSHTHTRDPFAGRVHGFSVNQTYEVAIRFWIWEIEKQTIFQWKSFCKCVDVGVWNSLKNLFEFSVGLKFPFYFVYTLQMTNVRIMYDILVWMPKIIIEIKWDSILRQAHFDGKPSHKLIASLESIDSWTHSNSRVNLLESKFFSKKNLPWWDAFDSCQCKFLSN